MNFLRGYIGEKKTAFKMWWSLDAKIYRRFHNIIVPSTNGTAQIDHLVISPYGVFIVETKNLKGWIFGSEHRPNWTQVLYREKYVFQNPLRQTYRQKKVLAEYLGLDGSAIHTVVYFVGDCRFKTPMPANVLRSRLGRYIRRFRTPVLSGEAVDRLAGEIERLVTESSLSRRDHLRSLRRRHTSRTLCPRCGSRLVERTARNGPNAGSRFLGCSAYPNCRFTRSL